MKRSIRFSLLCAGVCALLPVTGAFAQNTAAPAAPAAPTATPSVAVPPAGTAPADEPRHKHGGKGAGKGAGKGEGHMKGAMAALTPEERHQLRLAHDKAMAEPAMKEAEANRANDRKGYRQALRAAMIKADPTIEPVLDKMRDAKGNGRMKKKDLQTN